MALITVLPIAVGLAMDALAVSIVSGATYKQLKLRHALRMALFFGGFQAAMPIVGFLAGLSIRNYIAGYDHWVAFGLLSAIGLKMIYESFQIGPARQQRNPMDVAVLLVLSVATSIDALAVGVTLSLITDSVIAAAVVIGLVTFCLSYLGVMVGKRFGHFFENQVEAIGGLILIAIGLKILLQHLL